MKIEIIGIEKIKPYENNAKEHPQWQIEQIKESIQQFGNNDPIAVDENNIIIEGHGRYLALKDLGYKKIEIIKLNHLSDIDIKKYMIAHNKITMNTSFDKNILMSELALMEYDAIGFSEEELIELKIPKFEEIEEDQNFKDVVEKAKTEKRCPHCNELIHI